jgi:acetyltransferase
VSVRNLDKLFAPESVAVIGASDRPRSVGATVMRNLLNGGFRGPVWPVNLKRATVAGERAYRSVADLPAIPDLAIVCTPAAGIPALIAEIGARGTRAAVVLSGGLEQPSPSGGSLTAAMLNAARPHALRILGPNCIGLLVPGVGLNASFAHTGAVKGDIAFVAQSGALTTAMLDWADSAGIGFSHFISLGNAADVDFGDLLDFLGKDPRTRAILLYMESLTAGRKFMSAARAAARNKPVIAVKAGRTAEGARAAHSHTGALAGTDAVYDAALRRAGIVRVSTTRQLFEAAEMLSGHKPYLGRRLAIVSNGGGPAILATDALVANGGQLAALAPDTFDHLDSLLPSTWSHGNPVDIGGDADAERYRSTLEVVREDPGVDALLLLHAPTAIVSTAEVAQACVPVLEAARQPALACWLGGARTPMSDATAAGRRIGYSTPEEAIEAFGHLSHFHQVQAMLVEVPSSIVQGFRPDTDAARALIGAAMASGRGMLTESDSKALLAAYGIPVVDTRTAREFAELKPLAAAIGYPVALKILSAQITHKSDVGGVALDLGTPEELERAATAMLRRCGELRPDAQLEGFSVQQMIRRPKAYELIAGIAVDPTFGPVVLFGDGGTGVEILADRALGLPPLNSVLTRDVISQTRVYRRLLGYRDRPAVDMRAIESTLVKLARLAADLAEIAELDINPLLADEHGVIALDARVGLRQPAVRGLERLVIRPYPSELEETVEHRGRRLVLRPIRPEDFPQHHAFLARVAPEDLRTRFFCAVHELPDLDLAHLTQIDYEREMAFIAVGLDGAGLPETLAVARAHGDADNSEAEFAVLVRSDLKRQGLGSLLMRKLIRYCRARGTRQLTGDILGSNSGMLQFALGLGFRIAGRNQDIARVELDLQAEVR